MVNILKKLAGFSKTQPPVEEDQYLAEYENGGDEESAADASGAEAVADEEVTAADEAAESDWMEDDYEEGQLSIDVYQTPETIIVKSTIAGVRPEDIDISINNDMLTIRGRREEQERIKEEDYLYRECYWGSFSRSIILPVEVQGDKIEAFLENGVLMIVLPKARPTKQISVKVREK